MILTVEAYKFRLFQLKILFFLTIVAVTCTRAFLLLADNDKNSLQIGTQDFREWNFKTNTRKNTRFAFLSRLLDGVYLQDEGSIDFQLPVSVDNINTEQFSGTLRCQTTQGSNASEEVKLNSLDMQEAFKNYLKNFEEGMEHVSILDSKTIEWRSNNLSTTLLADLRHLVFHKKPQQQVIDDEPYVYWRMGQYKPVALQSNHSLRLRLKAEKIGDKSLPQEINFVYMPTLAEIIKALHSGSLDIVGLEIENNNIVALSNYLLENKLPYEIQMQQDDAFDFLYLNLVNPLLADSRVRRALFFALGRQELIDLAYSGQGYCRNFFVETAAVDVVCNPDKVQAFDFLSQAGWKQDSQGQMRRGKLQMILEFFVNKDNARHLELAKLIKDQFAKIGITLQLRKISGKTLFDLVDKNLVKDLAILATKDLPEELLEKFVLKRRSLLGSKILQKHGIEKVVKYLKWSRVSSNISSIRVEDSLRNFVPWIPLISRKKIMLVKEGFRFPEIKPSQPSLTCRF